jgi:hypothetical protein
MKLTDSKTLGFALLLLGSAVALNAAEGSPRFCAGTYLIQQASGPQSLWTFDPDGAFLGTSSAQPLFHFSNQQGAWTENDQGAQGVLLDFSFDASGNLINVARVDASLHTVGDGCGNIAGSFSLRFCTAGEDPLNPSTCGAPTTDTFTGRRLIVGH